MKKPTFMLEVLVFDEQERDGEAYSGPKHWHLAEVVARLDRSRGA